MIHSVTAVLVDMKKLMNVIQKNVHAALLTTKVHLEAIDRTFLKNSINFEQTSSIHPQKSSFERLVHQRICKIRIGN